MIGAIVLAAGESRRMGTQKLLLPLAHTTVVAHIVDRVLASRADRTVVITGYSRDAVESALAGKPLAFAHNADFKDGMIGSIRRGIEALPAECRAYLVVLGDQPRIRTETIDALIDAHAKKSHGVVVPEHCGTTGHPVLVAARFRDAIMARFDAEGLRGLLRENPLDVLRVPVTDDGILFDMDTPADYARERASIESA
jgi:molybdenum cofactor cytidylyltransferase